MTDDEVLARLQVIPSIVEIRKAWPAHRCHKLYPDAERIFLLTERKDQTASEFAEAEALVRQLALDCGEATIFVRSWSPPRPERSKSDLLWTAPRQKASIRSSEDV